ncbi:hypothetical protein QJS04_geneDACA013978 [Acorus gramineus]|uniref:Polymerase nucleotidyl transferase domain-containing protein n=1 Tax=Acorus gramineus TaxID=55184 RepID=A0AAV9AYM6_ACOGR|nr:hypothetical protein QJS04_geneDACA013978 [Acorus gramineus]
MEEIRLNGLLSDSGSVTRELDAVRWAVAERRTAELITRIQPNENSNERRNAVSNYVQRLISQCFSCQVIAFGSVPLKTYLPDGDIDLTACSPNQALKDTWATTLRDLLEKEEKSQIAEFRVKEVQYIQAEADVMIGKNHLFKRSIILIKAWCYYESRTLGAHHGLISTYALEILVLYTFHVFNNCFAGPLEVLYRFLEFFSNFDWDSFCVSLWGPVPISKLPQIAVELPRKDSGRLLLGQQFHDACNSVYAVFPSALEQHGPPFVPKHFNIIDPLRTNNNLGRSVSKGNFFRVRSAFAFGAKRLARLLECPMGDIVAEVNQFFMNTLDRHGSGIRPDAPNLDLRQLQYLDIESIKVSGEKKNFTGDGKKGVKLGSFSGHDNLVEGTNQSCVASSQPDTSENFPRANKSSVVSHVQGKNSFGNPTSTRALNESERTYSSVDHEQAAGGRKFSRPDYPVNAREGQERYQLAKKQFSPDLVDAPTGVLTQERSKWGSGMGRNQFAAKPDAGSRRKNLDSGVIGSQLIGPPDDHPPSVRQSSSSQRLDGNAIQHSSSTNYGNDAGFATLREELPSESERGDMMSYPSVNNLTGQFHLPMNVPSHVPLSLMPTAVTPVDYPNVAGIVPENISVLEPPWGANMQFSQGSISSQLHNHIPPRHFSLSTDGIIDRGNEDLGFTEREQENGNHGFWHEQCAGSIGEYNQNNRTLQMFQYEDNQQPIPDGNSYIPRVQPSTSSSSSRRNQAKFIRQNSRSVRMDYSHAFKHHNGRGVENNFTESNANARTSSMLHVRSSRVKPASESSYDGSSGKVSRSARDKRGRRVDSPAALPAVHGKAKSETQYDASSSDNVSVEADDDDNRDWIPLMTMGTELDDQSLSPLSQVSSNVQTGLVSESDSAHTSRSDTVIPIPPMLVGPGSRQGSTDNPGLLRFSFVPTGPPVPFVTMIPVYHHQSSAGNSDASASCLANNDGLDQGRIHKSDENFELADSHDQSADVASLDNLEEQKYDILNSDFTGHLQNLNYGRFCQSTRNQGPLIYNPPIMMPPVYLQGNFMWNGNGRPIPVDGKFPSQLMNNGPQFVPIASIPPAPNRLPGSYQHQGNETHRYHGGTGTFLPNPKTPFRDRQSSGARNHRGNRDYDRTKRGDGEGSWIKSKSLASGFSNGRTQAGKLYMRTD